MVDELERLQPLFRFLDRINSSKLVGLFFSIIFLTAVIISWYRVCFSGGDVLWKNHIISWNKRIGINAEWVTPRFLKFFMHIFLLWSIIGLSLALIANI